MPCYWETSFPIFHEVYNSGMLNFQQRVQSRVLISQYLSEFLLACTEFAVSFYISWNAMMSLQIMGKVRKSHNFM